jgi:hypothetical protein
MEAVDNLCVAFTGNHVRCANRAAPVPPIGSPHLRLCGIHRNQHMAYVGDGAGIHPAGRCLHVVRHARGPRYTWCENAHAAGSAYCERHIENHANNRRAVRAVRIWAEGGPAGFDAAHGWHEFDEAEDDFRAWLEAHRLVPNPVLAPAAAGAGPPPPDPAPDLRRLARDNQNVHTGLVNRVTEEGIARLCAVPVPASQDTRRIVLHAFTGMAVPYEALMVVWNDLEHWWRTDRCRVPAHAPPDNLYRNTLRGLVAYIGRVESEETRSELYRRLYQEAYESVGMCCDGHMARLVNVLVGFDDAFRPPVSQGELIQNRIAAIAGLEGVSVEERLRQANAFFDEIAYPAAERTAWLDVLAE